MPFLGEVCALGSSCVWAASTLLFARAGLSAPPYVLNTVKCTLAFVLLALTATVLLGAAWPAAFSRTELLLLGASGLVGLSLGDTLYFESLTRLGPRRSLLLLSLAAPLTAVLAALVLGERLGAWALVGIGITTAGVAWVIRERASADAGGAPAPFSAVLFGVGGALAQAAANVCTKAGSGEHDAAAIGAVRTGAAVLGLALHVALARGGGSVTRALTSRQTMKYLGTATFLGTYLGIWLVSAGMRYAPAGIAATLSSTSPLFVLPLVALVHRERISLRAWVGALVAVGGIALLFIGER